MEKKIATKKAPARKAAAKAAIPTHDDIAIAAYYIAESRGFEPGHELDDWFSAEITLQSANGNGAKPKAAPKAKAPRKAAPTLKVHVAA